MYPLINDVETGKTPEYPHIQPQRFELPPAEVLAIAEAVARAMPRWKKHRVEGTTIRAVAITPRLRFRDDITIRVEADAEGTIVNMRGKSRLGRGDFGQNARTIQGFQKALEAAIRRG